LPAVPSCLAFWGSAIVLSIVTNRKWDKLLFHCTLAKLLAVRQDCPTAARIAIEYLKQSETKENQGFIDRKLVE
jgi:hypothetical protein